jgi:DNA replication protein DnaC
MEAQDKNQTAASTKISDFDSETAIIRTTLHAAGRQTAGMTRPQLDEALSALRLEQANRAANEKAERERSMREAQQRELREAKVEGERRRQAIRKALGLPVGATDEQVATAQDKAWRDRQAAIDRQRIEERFVAGNFPKRHVRHLDGIDGDNRQWLSVRDDLVNRAVAGDGFLVILLGPRGTGKTQLAVSVAHRICQSLDKGVRYLRARQLFRETRAAFGEGATVDEGDVIKRLASVGLLVIDEVHQRGYTAYEDNTLVEIVDQRYADYEVPTILIANQTKQEFSASIGDSIVSRVHETGEAFVLDAKCYRTPGMWNEDDED